mmetsp:Transcript_28467/g.71988  ORF Transcript_28467/g.71988 Transcript_28467/m.71988 type:complete len:340 (-) Transcript_28467:218-1237(-)
MTLAAALASEPCRFFAGAAAAARSGSGGGVGAEVTSSSASSWLSSWLSSACSSTPGCVGAVKRSRLSSLMAFAFSFFFGCGAAFCGFRAASARFASSLASSSRSLRSAASTAARRFCSRASSSARRFLSAAASSSRLRSSALAFIMISRALSSRGLNSNSDSNHIRLRSDHALMACSTSGFRTSMTRSSAVWLFAGRRSARSMSLSSKCRGYTSSRFGTGSSMGSALDTLEIMPSSFSTSLALSSALALARLASSCSWTCGFSSTESRPSSIMAWRRLFRVWIFSLISRVLYLSTMTCSSASNLDLALPRFLTKYSLFSAASTLVVRSFSPSITLFLQR